MCNLNAVNEDIYNDYHYIHIEKVYDKGGSYKDSIENGLDDLYNNLKPIIIEFLDKDELVKLIITFDVNESGKDVDEKHGTSFINIRKNKSKHRLEVYPSKDFKSYCAKYYPKLKEALDNIGFEYRFKDEEEYLANKIKKDMNAANCSVNTSKYDDAHNINGNNPFTSIIGDVEVLEDENIKDNIIRIELLDDIKALIDGRGNSGNLLHYDAEIVTKIKEVLIACYERVEKDLQK